MVKNINYATIFQIFLILGIVFLYPSLGFSAGDPLQTLNTNLKTSVATFQMTALIIAGVAFIVTALMGMVGRLDTSKMLIIFAAIVLIAGAVLFVDWAKGWIQP